MKTQNRKTAKPRRNRSRYNECEYIGTHRRAGAHLPCKDPIDPGGPSLIARAERPMALYANLRINSLAISQVVFIYTLQHICVAPVSLDLVFSRASRRAFTQVAAPRNFVLAIESAWRACVAATKATYNLDLPRAEHQLLDQLSRVEVLVIYAFDGWWWWHNVITPRDENVQRNVREFGYLQQLLRSM